MNRSYRRLISWKIRIFLKSVLDKSCRILSSSFHGSVSTTSNTVVKRIFFNYSFLRQFLGIKFVKMIKSANVMYFIYIYI